MAYEPKYTKPYEGGYQDLPSKETPVTAEILNSLEDAVTSVEEQLKETTEIYDTNKINFGRASSDTNKVPYNVAFGYYNTSSGYASFAEGIGNTVTEQYGHVEGSGNTVSAIGAHAEGTGNTADGPYSHVEGMGNKSSSPHQHIQGRYNEEDTYGRFAHVVGGGSSDTNRKNIHTIDWSGNAYFAGEVEDGAGNYLSRKAQGISMEIEDGLFTVELLTSAGIVCGTAQLTAEELQEALEIDIIQTDITTLKDDVSALQNAQDITTTTDPTMQNSYPGRVLINEIGGGETQQGSTTGAQLFDISKLKGTTVSADEDDWISVSYDNTEGTSDYYISVNVPASDLLTVNTEYVVVGEIESINGVSLELVSKVIGSTIGQFSTSVITSVSGTKVANVTTRESFDDCNTMLRTMCTFPAGSNGSIKFRISVLADTSVTADTFVYEKFTGGIASPNPDYPQEIEATVVSEVKTVGNNLFAKDTSNLKYYDLEMNLTDSTVWYLQELNVQNLSQITISGINMYGTSVVGKTNYGMEKIGDIRNSVYDVSAYDTIYYSIHTNNFETAQVEEGSVATEYEPYTETVQTLTNPITLYKIGDVQDKIVGGNVVRKFKEVVFDGSDEESWSIQASNDSTVLFRMNNGLYTTYGCRLNDYSTGYLCSHTKPNSTNAGGTQTDIGSYVYTNTFRIRVPIELASTADEFIAWLSDNHITCIFPLQNEETEPLPLADKLSLSSLPTYNTVTHLSTDAEIEPTYELKYGTSEVGGYTLEGLLTGRNAELLAQSNAEVAQSNAERLTALESAVVSNI